MRAIVSAVGCMPLLGRACHSSLNLCFCTIPNRFWYCRTVLITFIPLNSYCFEINLKFSPCGGKGQFFLNLPPHGSISYPYDAMFLSPLCITQECLESR